MTVLDRAKGLGPRDRVQLAKDGEWFRLASSPNTAGWFTIAYDLSTHHLTEVVQTLCWESSTGCVTSNHCGRCGNCGHRGGPYGCHCECDDNPDDACQYCDPEPEDPYGEDW